MESLASRFLSSFSYRIAGQLLLVVIGFFMMPFLVNNLGAHLYGIWTLIATILGYYTYLDIGLMIAAQRQIAFSLEGGEQAISVAFNTAFFLFTAIALGIVAVLAIILLAVTAFDVGVQTSIGATNVRIIILILGLSLALSFPVKAFIGFLNARIRQDKVNTAMMAKFILSSGCIVWAISAGNSIMAMFFITVASSLLEHVLVIFFAYREYPALTLRLTDYSRSIAKEMFNYGWKSFSSQMADLLRSKGGEFVIALYVSPAMLTHYVIGGRLVEYFSQIIQQGVGVITPYFSQLDGRDNPVLLQETFFDSLRVSAALSFYIAGSMLLFGEKFIQLWMGDGFTDSYQVMAILTVAYGMNLALFPNFCLLFGTARHAIYATINVIEAFVSIVLVLVFVRFAGIYGVAVAVALEMIIFKIFVLPLSVCRSFKIEPVTYYFQVILPVLLKVGIFFVPFYLFVPFMPQGNLLSIAASAIAQTAIFAIFFFFLLLPDTIRQKIKGIIKRG